LLKTGLAHASRRIVAHTDCKALLRRSRQRDAHRLARAAMRGERNRDRNSGAPLSAGYEFYVYPHNPRRRRIREKAP
jgi:hypothetical protein